MKPPLISLALIAGPAEGEILRRLIDSARGLWDEVVVVAATGSQPYGDLEKALKEAAGDAGKFAIYKNAPQHADWPHIDNFAAARNQAFDLATGRFVIWADCDDIFEPGQAAAHRAQVEACAAGKEQWDLLVTLYDVQNSGMRNNKRERIFRRMENGKLCAHWERQIHERVTPRANAKVAVAEHLKILHAPSGPKVSSAERNKRIIASRLQGIGMEWYYLAQEHFLKNQYSEAIGPCLLALEHADVGATEKYQLHCQASMMLSERTKRLKHIGKAITLSPMRREAHGLLATDRMDHGDMATAYHILKQVDAMPTTQDWNQENRWYKHLPRQLMAQCLRGLSQHDQANALVREGFCGAWGRITVIHAGEPDDCLKSMALYTDCADGSNGIQHLLLTKKGHKIADRLHVVQSAAEAIEAALGDRLLMVTAKDAPLPGLRWDAALLEDGCVPPAAELLPSPIERKGHVRVCLTTTPKRIHTILPTLKSLLAQSRPADEIVLSIPETLARTGEKFGPIPAAIQALADEGRITILRSTDHGPATKFVSGSWEANPDDFIIWCDDDILYSPRMVQTLVENCPDKSALGLCGFFMTGPKGYAIAPDHLGHAEIIEGFGGVCCRKKDLPDMSLWPAHTAKEFAKLDDRQRAEFLADDFMMSTRLREKGTATLVCATPDFNRANGIRIRPEGLGEDALQNNKQTGGKLAAYALLKK